MLFFTGKNKDEEVREFGCSLELLEEEFDFLNTLIVDGYTLIAAHLTDGRSRIDLPVEAFDGLPLSVSIRAMQDDWESILYLSAPDNPVHRKELIDLTYRRMEDQRLRMISREDVIYYLESLLVLAQRMEQTPRRDRLLHQYERMIISHIQYLKKGQFRSALLNRRLDELTA